MRQLIFSEPHTQQQPLVIIAWGPGNLCLPCHVQKTNSFSVLLPVSQRLYIYGSPRLSDVEWKLTFCLADYEYCTEDLKSKHARIVLLWQSGFIAITSPPPPPWQITTKMRPRRDSFLFPSAQMDTYTYISLFFNSFRHWKTRTYVPWLVLFVSGRMWIWMTYSLKRCRQDERNCGDGVGKKHKSSV